LKRLLAQVFAKYECQSLYVICVPCETPGQSVGNQRKHSLENLTVREAQYKER